MVDAVLSFLFAAASLFSTAVLLKVPALKQSRNIRVLFPKNRNQLLFGVAMIVSVVLVTSCLLFVYKASWIFCLKRIILCSVLWYLSFIDYRKHIIPNKVLLGLVVLRICILIAEVFLSRQTIKKEIISDLIAGLGVILVFLLLRFLVRNGIGLGDIKLFAVIGFYLGVNSAITVICSSFLVAFVCSLGMLVTKKKNKKDQMAFAPFILAGTMLAVALLGA